MNPHVVALRAVLALHRRDVHGVCVECSYGGDGADTFYPCPTVNVITAKLGGVSL